MLRNVLYVLTICLIVTVGPSFSPGDELDPNLFMPVDEIQRGMKGYGLTVFSGTEIDTFDVEVLGVLEGVTPKADLILARLSGGPLEKTGIYGGMSGSPIYIDGRLVGAAAYGWTFAKDPIAGITPIGEMFDIWNYPSESEEQRRSGTFGFGEPFEEDQTLIEDISIPQNLLNQRGDPSLSAGTFLRQWGAPVALAGFDEQVIELMNPVFEQFDLTPVQGGSSSGEREVPPLQAGSTVAAQLIRGDASASVVGTVTLRQDDRILAFGHPMFRAGKIDLPMTAGVVHTVFPSQYRSFKMTSATQPVGSFTQDRRAGTAGLIGSTARLIPCNVEIRKDDWTHPERYQYEIANDRLFTPNLVGWTVANSILATERLSGTSSLRVVADIIIDTLSPITLENFFSGDMAWLKAATNVAAPVALLMDNPFEEVNIREINLTIWSEEELRAAIIDAIHIDKLTAKPGDSVELSITVKPYQEPLMSKKVVLKIPDDAPNGMVKVIAADAKTIKALEKARAPYNYKLETLDQFVELIRAGKRNNEIVALLYRTAHGITVEGEELPSLPTSILSVMASGKVKGDSGPTKGIVLSEECLPTEYFISGSQTLNLRIDRNAQ